MPLNLAAAGVELAAFIVNTTIGVVGFREPAKNRFNLDPNPEDFGQSLATYGLGHGFYIVWPIFGPSSLGDTVGLVGDQLLTPTTYLASDWRIAVSVIKTINGTSLNIGRYEAVKEAALDPYDSIRDGYIQYRNEKVKK